MSGPIVRKYGFPNFEKIFGEKPLLHGVEEPKPVEGATAVPKDAADDAAKGRGTPDRGRPEGE